MSDILLHLQQRFRPSDLEAFATDLGISAETMQRGFQSAAALVLQALTGKPVSERAAINKLLKEWPSGPHVLRSGLSGETEKAGARLLQALFGAEQREKVALLSVHATMPEPAASALLNAGAMAVGGELHEALNEEGEGFWAQLLQWSGQWQEALPTGAANMNSDSRDDEETKRRLMLPILLLVVLGIGLWYWAKGCTMERSMKPDTGSAVIDSAGHSIDDAVQKASSEIDDMQDSVRAAQ